MIDCSYDSKQESLNGRDGKPIATRSRFNFLTPLPCGDRSNPAQRFDVRRLFSLDRQSRLSKRVPARATLPRPPENSTSAETDPTRNVREPNRNGYAGSSRDSAPAQDGLLRDAYPCGV